jgi:PAS domain S-box-containing protein
MKELKLRVEALTVYKLMIDEAPDMLCVLSPDREGKVLFANEAFARLLQTQADLLTSKPFWEVVHPEDCECVLKAFSETILSKDEIGKATCRIRPLSMSDTHTHTNNNANGGVDGYIKVSLAMRKGTQGLVTIIRPVD